MGVWDTPHLPASVGLEEVTAESRSLEGWPFDCGVLPLRLAAATTEFTLDQKAAEVARGKGASLEARERETGLLPLFPVPSPSQLGQAWAAWYLLLLTLAHWNQLTLQEELCPFFSWAQRIFLTFRGVSFPEEDPS